MTTDLTPEKSRAARNRVVVDYDTGLAGPAVVAVAGLHGDEIGGVKAVERVGRALQLTRPRMNGRLICILGNLAALDAGTRFIDRDLNRQWFDERIYALRAQNPDDDGVEDAEQRELLAFLDEVDRLPNHPIVFLDLHSTSAHGPAFSCMPDTLLNLRYALKLPFPAVLGLEETINGPLLGYLSDNGFGGVIVEGGKHDDPDTADILESSLWVFLAGLGCLREEDVPDYDFHHARLARIGQDLPRVLEVLYRHETKKDDGFAMLPDFRHYDRVRKGQRLATDDDGDIVARKNGRMIMPSYQANTEQGFFIARDIPWLYVMILFLIRRLRLGRLGPVLPGARKHPDNPNLMIVSGWVPDFLVNIIRLLGWRRTHYDSQVTLLRRRLVRK